MSKKNTIFVDWYLSSIGIYLLTARGVTYRGRGNSNLF